LDKKQEWVDRLNAIEMNVGEINSSLLYFSLILIRHSLENLLSQRQEIAHILYEERHGKSVPKGQQFDEDEKNKGLLESTIKQRNKEIIDEIVSQASPMPLLRIKQKESETKIDS